MPSELAERRAARGHQMGAPQPLPTAEQQEPLPCPRCDSTNTKFCYYNNYNFSQPRHFCKACRRYWTHGGTLRDIPIGGGSRKSAKRSRTTSATSATSSSSAYLSSGLSGSQPPIPSTPVFVPLPSSGPGPITAVSAPASSFTSLLNGTGPGVGVLPTLGGFGLGLGLEDVGFGLGQRGVWALPDHPHQVGIGYLSSGGGGINGGEGGGAGGGSSCGGDGGSVNRGDTWQVESGEADFGAGTDCFASLPELAISTPGNGLK